MNNRKASLAKAKLVEWSLNSTVQGYPNLFRTERTSMRLVWLLSLLVAICLCCVMLVQSILQYVAFEVNTRVRVVRPTEGIRFPAISVCPASFLSTEGGFQFARDYFANQTNSTVDSLDDLRRLLPHNSIEKGLYVLRQTAFELDEAQQRTLSFAQDEILLKCMIRGLNCTSQQVRGAHLHHTSDSYIYFQSSSFSLIKIVNIGVVEVVRAVRGLCAHQLSASGVCSGRRAERNH